MDEKRRTKRIPIGFKLGVSDIYADDPGTVIDTSSPVEITDISPRGIGFVSADVLPIGYFFIANIELDRNLPQIITDIRIIRSQAIDNGHYQYGCEFVSISPRVKKMLDDFEHHKGRFVRFSFSSFLAGCDPCLCGWCHGL